MINPALSSVTVVTEAFGAGSAAPTRAASALGTNADPKIPASKLAVATVVANFFLMN
jgi:hypothetical protein